MTLPIVPLPPARPHAVFALALAFGVLAAGCAAPADEADASGEADGPVVVHSAQEEGVNFFDPVEVHVEAGTEITWDVTGPGHHTVTFATDPNTGGARRDSGDIGPGDTFQVTFEKPGTYPYWCRYHSDGKSGMAGTVVVE